MERVFGSRLKKIISVSISLILLVLLLNTFFLMGNHDELHCSLAGCSICTQIETAKSIIYHIKVSSIFNISLFIGICFGVLRFLIAGREEEAISLVRLKIRMDN